MVKARIPYDPARIAEFCRRRHIRKLSFFGSVIREDFSTDSDVDVLVEFDPGHIPGFLRLFEIEEELSGLVGGRKVDLVIEKSLNPRIRRQILESAEVEYAEG
jgi:uncharacterized protein